MMEAKIDEVKIDEVKPEEAEPKEEYEGGMSVRKTFLGNLGVKIILFFMLTVSGVITLAAGAAAVFMLGKNSYRYTETEFVENSMSYMNGEAWEIFDNYTEYKGDKARQDKVIGRLLDGTGEGVKIYKDEQLVYRYPEKHRDDYVFTYELTYYRGAQIGVEYTVKILVDKTNPVPVRRPYLAGFLLAGFIYRHSAEIYTLAVLGLLLSILFFVLLMCAAGHRNGRKGIVPGVLHRIHFDVLTIGMLVIAMLEIAALEQLSYDMMEFGVALVLFVIFDLIIGTWYCMEGAIRIKRGELFRSTLIGTVWRFCVKILRKIWQFTVFLFKSIPVVPITVIVFLVIALFEFIGIMAARFAFDLFPIWLIEKIVLFALVIYLAICIKKLMKQSRSLAEGDLSSKVDTKYMIPQLREAGEDLNHISDGLSRAVDDRMRSERLKTELITNVSHDLKTPLTSIINYAELLSDERLEQAKVPEYAEVLYRQSQRLKKLLDDLIQASKASTGNMEVNFERVDVGVILTQAGGEYEQRLTENQLELIMRQPEEPVYIRADGRHLWRVFDNLLSNIVKYSQENSRVYITLQADDKCARIVFRNMSKYALDIDASELGERFVRGDKSRHMEGSGLGLSIAMSLVELQGGYMDITTDGDLFKVTLEFDREYR